MLYSEIVEKVRHCERLSMKDISGFQLLMLLKDRELKDVMYYGNTFEVNFIPITYTFEAYVLKEEELSSFRDGEEIIDHWIYCYKVNKSIYVQIEDEYFEIKLELLESP